MLTTHNKQDAIKSKQSLRKLIICIAIILVAVGATVWILNITDTIKGSWSNICTALFTSLGTLLTIIQLYIQFKEERTLAISTTTLASDVQPPNSLNGDFSISLPSGQEGRLVIYTKRSLRGSSVDLCRGYRFYANTYAAQNIVEYKIRGHTYYIAVFESLLPGPYTAQILKREMTARITIYAGKVSTVDWR